MAGLREECERGNRSRHGSGASSSGEGMDYPEVEETLQVIMFGLREKRQEASRPEDLTVSSGTKLTTFNRPLSFSCYSFVRGFIVY